MNRPGFAGGSVQEHESEYASRWEAMRSIAPKFGCSAYSLLEWVKKAEVDKSGL